MDTNTAGSSMNGASDEKIAALYEFRSSDLFSEAEKAALEIAEAMTHTPCDVTDEMFETARKWYSEGQMVEIAGTVAMENYRARFNRVFDVESENVCQIRGITPLPRH
ncbi:MAG: hypothetical protein ABI305_04600 [Tepidiformaceae bacterium]